MTTCSIGARVLAVQGPESHDDSPYNARKNHQYTDRIVGLAGCRPGIEAMRVMEIAPEVFATGQVTEQDLKLVADQGIRTVINNRPDHEEPGQPLTGDLQQAAEALGMRYVYLPVVAGAMTPANIEDFREVYPQFEKPLLIFCRTGARSTSLFNASSVE